MSVQDKVSIVNDMVQASFGNAMNTVEIIHRTSAEMPLGVLKELGYPEEKVETIRESHREILRILYGGITNTNQEIGKLMVAQTGELTKFVSSMLAAGYQARSGSSWNTSKSASGTAGKEAATVPSAKAATRKATPKKKPSNKAAGLTAGKTSRKTRTS